MEKVIEYILAASTGTARHGLSVAHLVLVQATVALGVALRHAKYTLMRRES